MRVSIVGAGYVGLVSGVCLADLGHEIICVDVDEAKVDSINAARCPIHEEGLPERLTRLVGSRLRATTDLDEAVAGTEVTILTVGTPFGDDQIDLAGVVAAADRIGRALAELDRYHVVAVKSTVVPGTTEDVVGPAIERSSGKRIGPDVGLAMNPEFLREGVAVQDFLTPDRIVLGGVDERTLDVLSELYAVFDDTPVLRVAPRTAEMIKYASNALLATLISFSNEVGNLSARAGADVVDVLNGVQLDRRLSPIVDGTRVSPGILSFLAAGCGFGGSCFPKDVKALVAYGEAAGIDMRLLDSVLAINESQAGVLVDRLQAHLDPDGRRIAVLGAAFKPGTDDVRGSPTLSIVPRLLALGAVVVVHDPVATDNCRSVLGHRAALAYSDDLDAVVEGADAVLLVTAWPDYERLPSLLDSGHDGDEPVVVDGRRLLPPDSVARYDGIGFPSDGPRSVPLRGGAE